MSLAGLWISLVQITGPMGISLPWPTIAAVAAGCAVLAVLTSVASAMLADRGGPAAQG
ncbi:holin [Streptomyces sp. NBC_00433]